MILSCKRDFLVGSCDSSGFETVVVAGQWGYVFSLKELSTVRDGGRRWWGSSILCLSRNSFRWTWISHFHWKVEASLMPQPIQTNVCEFSFVFALLFWTQYCLLPRTILFSLNTKSWNSSNFQTHERSYGLIFASDCLSWKRSLFHHNDETWLFRMTEDDLTSNRVVRLLVFKSVTKLAPSSYKTNEPSKPSQMHYSKWFQNDSYVHVKLTLNKFCEVLNVSFRATRFGLVWTERKHVQTGSWSTRSQASVVATQLWKAALISQHPLYCCFN